MDLNRLSLNTATVSKQWNLEQCIEACDRHAVRAIGPWRQPLQECGVSKAAEMIKRYGLEVSTLCRGGMFPVADLSKRKEVMDDNRRAIDEALEIGAQNLVLVVGGLPDGSKDIEDARTQVEDSIAELLEYSRKYNMPLAVEPLHPMYAADRACVNTLKQALELCNKLGDGIGIAVDVYHVWWDPDLFEMLEKISGKVLGYHVCDWLKETESLLTDRGMMGDGIIDIKKISQNLDYSGYVEVEIFSDKKWWKEDPDKVMKIMKERFVECV